MKEKNADVRAAAATALGKMGSAAEPAVSYLAAALRDKSEEVRDGALEALGTLGPIAKEAAPAVRAFITGNANKEAADAAAEVLARIESKEKK